jgi:hypothetical protein
VATGLKERLLKVMVLYFVAFVARNLKRGDNMEIKRVVPTEEEFIIKMTKGEIVNLLLDLESQAQIFRDTTQNFINQTCALTMREPFEHRIK